MHVMSFVSGREGRSRLTHLDGHARAVEGEGEEHLLALQAVVRGCELQLGQAESVAEVEHAVHVRVREVAEELWGLGACDSGERAVHVRRIRRRGRGPARARSTAVVASWARKKKKTRKTTEKNNHDGDDWGCGGIGSPRRRPTRRAVLDGTAVRRRRRIGGGVVSRWRYLPGHSPSRGAVTSNVFSSAHFCCALAWSSSRVSRRAVAMGEAQIRRTLCRPKSSFRVRAMNADDRTTR